MKINTEKLKIAMEYKTRKIVNITNLLKGKNFEDLYMKAISENDLDALSKIIFTFAVDINTGLSPFKSSEEVYDFIDDYMKEQEKTYQDIFREIAEDINEAGFFKTKMTKEDLEKKITNYVALDINKIVEASARNVVEKIAEQEMMTQEA